jgi:purine nucleosidase/pyrimidine-specific ribonucleoside hydrolase
MTNGPLKDVFCFSTRVESRTVLSIHWVAKMENSMKPLCIWLDCDPGHDDALAILLCLASPGVNLLGISTVAGNQTVEKTTQNALNVLYVAGENNLPVIMGSATPLCRSGKICPEIHGHSGLDGFTFPSHNLRPTTASSPTLAIYHAITACPDPVTLIATGAQTNIAKLLMDYPDVVNHISSFVFMGGTTDGTGNTSPYAEFNIECDPEAVDVVLKSQLKNIVMVPLQVTHTALCSHSVLSRIQSMQSTFAELIISLLEFFRDTYRDVFGFADPPVHDPCAVAYALHPELFSCRRARVSVDVSASDRAGQLHCDFGDVNGNVVVCESMSVDSFWQVMVSALEVINKRCPLNG